MKSAIERLGREIPEREREALMRLTMCARMQCDICKYKDANNDECEERITKNMNILADALADRKDEPRHALVQELAEEMTYEDIIKAEAEAKGYAEGFREGLEAKDEPQTEEWHDDCNTCRWHDGACTIPCCDYEPKDEPQTYITEDRDTQVLDAWQVHHRNTTSVAVGEPQTDCAWQKAEE